MSHLLASLYDLYLKTSVGGVPVLSEGGLTVSTDVARPLKELSYL
jgi:hypothetical protein